MFVTQFLAMSCKPAAWCLKAGAECWPTIPGRQNLRCDQIWSCGPMEARWFSILQEFKRKLSYPSATAGIFLIGSLNSRGHSHPVQSYRLGEKWLESCPVEKVLGVPVDSRLDIGQQSVQVIKRACGIPGLCQK